MSNILLLLIIFYIFGVISMYNIIKIKNTDDNGIQKTSSFNEKFIIFCPLLNSILGFILLVEAYTEIKKYDKK